MVRLADCKVKKYFTVAERQNRVPTFLQALSISQNLPSCKNGSIWMRLVNFGWLTLTNRDSMALTKSAWRWKTARPDPVGYLVWSVSMTTLLTGPKSS